MSSNLFNVLCREQSEPSNDRIRKLCVNYGGEFFHSGGSVFLGLFNDGPGTLMVLSRDMVTRYTMAGDGDPISRYDKVREDGRDPWAVHEFKSVDGLTEEAMEMVAPRVSNALVLSVSEVVGSPLEEASATLVGDLRDCLAREVRRLVKSAVESES